MTLKDLFQQLALPPKVLEPKIPPPAIEQVSKARAEAVRGQSRCKF